MPHWKPPPQLVHAIWPATGVGSGDGVAVAVGPPPEHALIATMEAMSSATVRGLTKRVYRARELSLRACSRTTSRPRAWHARRQRQAPPITQLIHSHGGLVQLCSIEST